ncbi:hypothetical protein FDENT_8133 [Fusarium denticulatum]|uniref:Urease domain-containing protein n=1 Tax=Fusarium denticulatum TaxID=48507 RepID=A0A8H5WZE9_9HYPO|nr:hypothetical protein FDENT_8133 [Fusarium denticulatum]
MPFTTNTIDSHIDTAANRHRLSKDHPDDDSFLKNRIRKEAISAKDVLHDIGAISIMSFDSQAMCRSAQVLTRSWKAAHKNKVQRGLLDEDKDTGTSASSPPTLPLPKGSATPLAALRLGSWTQLMSLMSNFRSVDQCMHPESSVLFVSQASIAKVGEVHSYYLKKEIDVVQNCRAVKKRDLKSNSAVSTVKFDPETFNLSLSIHTAQPIFEQLSLWLASVLAPKSPMITTNNGMLNDKASYPLTIPIAHATLVTYVWRALLRPIVPSAVPPLIVDDQQLAEASLFMELQPHDIESLCWNLPDLSHLELPLRSSDDGSGSPDAVMQNLHQSSLA